ncbi:hypothetical protein ACFLX9_02295 [Chloroflexota bacterium]
MAGRIVRGQLLAVVDGPAMILSVNGQEHKFALTVQVSLDWVSKHMDKLVTVMVDEAQIIEIL